MPNRGQSRRFDLTPAEVMAEYFEERDDDFLDAIITAAAMVSEADNRVQPVEQARLLDFVNRHEFLSVLSCAETSQLFERRVGEMRKHDGLAAALIRLNRVAGRHYAPVVVGLSEEIATADCRLDPREARILSLIRIVLDSAALPLVKEELQQPRSNAPPVKCMRAS